MAESIKVKRQLIVKTIVTEKFREKAKSDLTNESEQLEAQIKHLEAQINQLVTKAQDKKNPINMPPQQIDQILNEMNQKHQSLVKIKQNYAHQLANLDHIKNGDKIVTGSLENYIQLKVGDHLYNSLAGNEIVIEDGIIKEIKD